MDERQEDIRACVDLKGREIMARKFRVSKTTLADWYNGKYPASDRAWFKAVTLLETDKTGIPGIPLAKLRRMCGVPLANLQECVLEAHSTSLPVKEPTYFERLKASKLDPLWQTEMRGRPATFSKNKPKKCADPHTFQGRIKDLIREKYGLHGKDLCEQAEVILEKDREDLMKAFDSGALYMTEAYQLLTTSPARVAVLLAQGKAAVRAFLKKQREAPVERLKAHGCKSVEEAS